MVTELDVLKAQLTHLDTQRRQRCVDGFRQRCNAWADGQIKLPSLCQDAGDALESYAVELLDALLGSTATLDRSAALSRWVLEQYHDGIASVSAALRDEVADRAARHAVAQTLQERVLRAELRLREVTPSEPAAGGAPLDPGWANQRTSQG